MIRERTAAAPSDAPRLPDRLTGVTSLLVDEEGRVVRPDHLGVEVAKEHGASIRDEGGGGPHVAHCPIPHHDQLGQPSSTPP